MSLGRLPETQRASHGKSARRFNLLISMPSLVAVGTLGFWVFGFSFDRTYHRLVKKVT